MMKLSRIPIAIIISLLTSFVTSQLVLSETETTSGGNDNNIPKKIYIPRQRPCLFLPQISSPELSSRAQSYERRLDASKHLRMKYRFARLRLSHNPFPQDSHLSKIAVQYASIGDFKQAFNIIKSIQQELLKAETLVSIAEFYVQEEDPQLAINTIFQALNLIKNSESESSKEVLFFSIASVYLQVADSYLDVGKTKLASEIILLTSQTIEHVEEKLFKEYLLSEIAPKLSAIGNMEEALAIAKKLDVNQDTRNDILMEIAVHSIGFAELEKALEIAQGLDKNRRDHTISQIAIKLASIGQFKQAITIVENFLDNKSVVIAKIAQQYIKKGKINLAVRTIQNVEDYCNRSKSFHELFSLLLEAEEYDLALQIADNIEAARIKSNALSTAAMKLAQIERYTQAITLIKSLGLPADQADALIKISSSLIEVGKSEQASEFLSQALEIVKSSPDLTRVYPQIPSAVPPQSPRITSPPVVTPTPRIKPFQPSN